MSAAPSSDAKTVILCPGQGAQAVGMGRAWADRSEAARSVFDAADAILSDVLPQPMSSLCFEGPAEALNRTDISQPAIYTCSVASYHGLRDRAVLADPTALAGLSLGEYTALHLAGSFDFETGLRLVALRGRLMQEAAEDSDGGMLALVGANEAQAEEVCERARGDWILVCANYNAPGQIVLSGQNEACDRAAKVAEEMGVRSARLTVAGAFHSPLMKPAADGLADGLANAEISPPKVETWANVTARPHDTENVELMRRRLVEQLTSPVRWSQTCEGLVSSYSAPSIEGSNSLSPGDPSPAAFHELAPGSVLKGLMRRIDRQTKVTSHDED